MMNDVAIIGVGLHPFGRFGDKSAMAMGADAIHAALSPTPASSGATSSSASAAATTVANPDAIVGLVGLTGIPFTDVFNACATAASAVQGCADAIRLGDYDIGIAFGHGQAPARRVHRRPRHWSACRAGTARTASTSPPSSSG